MFNYLIIIQSPGFLLNEHYLYLISTYPYIFLASTSRMILGFGTAGNFGKRSKKLSGNFG